MSILLQVYSDLHIENGDAFTPPKTDSDVIILNGDIHRGLNAIHYAGALSVSHKKPVIFVPGNHEYSLLLMPEVRREMRALAGAYPDLHLLDNQSVVINGVKFIGSTLWTDYQNGDPVAGLAARREAEVGQFFDMKYIRTNEVDYLTVDDVIALHDTCRAFIEGELQKAFDGPKIVVTHHAPSYSLINDKYPLNAPSHASFNVDCDDLIGLADAWVYGHTHANVRRTLGDCQIITNQRGNPNEHLPVPFKFDGLFQLELSHG